MNERGEWTSASNAQADSICPARHLAQRGLPETKGDFAETGTTIHQAIYNVELWHGDGLTLEQKETVIACQNIERDLLRRYFGDKAPSKVFREQRLWIYLEGGLRHSGQPDVVFRGGLRCLIVEYKSLFGDVQESPRNQQLRDQAVLVYFNHLPTTEVGVAVVQPRVSHSPEICVYTVEDLSKSLQLLTQRVIASNNPESKRNPDEIACQYCAAKPQCVPYQQWATRIAPPGLLGGLDIPMQSWTPQQRQIAADALKPCQDFLDDLKLFLKKGLGEDPQFCPGWKLVPGANREKVIEPERLFERFKAIGGELPAFMKCVTIAKGEFREAVHNATGATGAALSAAVDGLTKGLVEFGKNAPSLRREK